MADAESGGARRVDVIAVGDEQGVLTQSGRQHRLDGLGGHGREDAPRWRRSGRRHQDRRLFVRKAALGCLSAPPASLAPRRRSPLRLIIYRFHRLRRCRSTGAWGSWRRAESDVASERRAHSHPAPLTGRPPSRPRSTTDQNQASVPSCAIGPAASVSALSFCGNPCSETAQAVGLAPPTDAPPQCGQRRASPSAPRSPPPPPLWLPPQHRLELLALLRRQTVDLRQPRSKHPLIHRNPVNPKIVA